MIGASGQVGSALVRCLSARGDDVVGTHHRSPGRGTVPLSAGDSAATAALIEATAVDAVFFAAAHTNVDACEDDPATAFAINRDAPAAAATVAARRGAAFIFYSTEYVFDGLAGPYAEDAPARPLSVYGTSKLEGEIRIRDAHPGAIVVRTTVVYGIDAQEKNFVYQVLRRGRAGEAMKIPADQHSSPTYVEDLADASLVLLDKRLAGLFHVAGPAIVDRYALALDVCRVFAVAPAFLEPVTTASLGQRAPRPLRAGLRVDRLAALGMALRAPAEGLEAMRAALEGQRG